MASDPPVPYELRLVQLTWVSTDCCTATFVSDSGERCETTLRVSRTDDPRGETVVNSDNNALFPVRYDGTASDIRRVCAAVIALCDAVQRVPGG